MSAHSHGRWVERAYTVTGRPGDDAYEITVKREPQGLFSRWLFDVRTDADRLRVSKPQGDVPWANPGATMLCFVAGIGVAPALATCRATGTAACHIDYSGRRLAELAYVEELRATPGVSLVVRETATEGRLSAPAVRDLVVAHPAPHAFVCGPEGYLLDVAAHLRAAGVPPDRVHLEVFTHAGGPVQAPPERPKWMPRTRR